MKRSIITAAVLTVSVIAPLGTDRVSGGSYQHSNDAGMASRVTVSATSMTGRGEIEGSSSATSPSAAWLRAGVVSPIERAGATALEAPPPTPAPTYAFSSGTSQATRADIGGSPADSNVAVSRTHVCITTRAAFACYTKGGLLVKPGIGLAARPYTAADFFAASGLPIGAAHDGSTDDASVAKDGRIVFDQIRGRFFMVFQTRESPARLMIAASKSQDPRDGWWTYADTVGTATHPVQDYQWLGINTKYLLVSDRVQKSPGGAQLHKHFLYPAAKLASGQPYTRSVWTATGSNYAVPCDHDTNTTDAFYVDRDDATHLTVWAIRNDTVHKLTTTVKESSGAVNRAQLGRKKVIYTTAARAPQNCVYRDGKIVWAQNRGQTWSGQSRPNNVIHLGRLNVSQYFAPVPKITTEIDRIFGKANVGDPPGSVFDYGWPAVGANANGDIVVGQIRSNPTIYPEIRASAWYAGQTGLSGSTLVQASSSALGSYHMAGASADPSTAGIYISQQYGATSPSWRVRVAKILGKVVPDLIAVKTLGPRVPAMKRGQTYSATVTVLNQGDKTMPTSQATLRLSTNNTATTADQLLKSFSVPSLIPNQTTSVTVTFTVAARQPPGTYYLSPMLDSNAVATEYSETNNQNPFLAGNHGNIAVAVQ